MKTHASRSLMRETIGIVVAAQLLCAAVLCGSALLYERHIRLHALDISLQGRSDSLLGAIQDAEDPDDNVMIDPAELDLPSDDVYAVYNQGGRLLGTSRAAPAALVTRHADELRNAQVGRTKYRVLQREAMRVIDRAENKGIGLKRPVTIVYASSESHLWHEIFEAVRFYLVGIVLATALTVILVALLLRKALYPLTELAQSAEQLSAPALVFTAPPSVTRVRELRPLAEVLTDSVGRLREAFVREQQFVGDAAHELKTAVAVVHSSVQLLMLRRRTVEEYAAGLQRVLEDNRRVEALVAQMLQLASLEEASSDDAPATDLGKLIAETLEHLRPFAEERGVSLHFAPSPGMQVRLSPERGNILISNLIMNAIQHSPSGREVEVSLSMEKPGEVMLKVADDGYGISDDALPHIFKRFYREDRSRSRDTGGTGLGLSICQSIVHAAGGRIAVASSPGKGTDVNVIFMVA